MRAITVNTPGEAFCQGLKAVWEDGKWVGEKKELTNVVIEVTSPTQRSIYHDDIAHYLNEFHDPAEDGTPHLQAVSEWTFPEEVSTGLTGEPRPTDDSGEYFERLCDSEKGNQIASMVDKLENWGRNNRTVAQVFQVDRDLNAMFPPCLLDQQILFREGQINLTVHFRSHTLCKSFYGDILSQINLQKWLADRVDANVGSLVMFSSSLHVRKKNGENELARKMYNEVST